MIHDCITYFLLESIQMLDQKYIPAPIAVENDSLFAHYANDRLVLTAWFLHSSELAGLPSTVPVVH